MCIRDRHSALAERLGRNQRFASTGALVGAALMGIAGYLLSYQSIFLIVVLLGLPLFLALARIRAADVHFGRSCGAPAHHDESQPARSGRWILLKDFSTSFTNRRSTSIDTFSRSIQLPFRECSDA